MFWVKLLGAFALVFLALLSWSYFGVRKIEDDLASTPHGAVALRFATSLAEGRYGDAHAMLSPSLAERVAGDSLRVGYERTACDADAPIVRVSVVEAFTDWMDKGPSDMGWAAAAVTLRGCHDPAVVSVVVSKAGQISDIDWDF